MARGSNRYVPVNQQDEDSSPDDSVGVSLDSAEPPPLPPSYDETETGNNNFEPMELEEGPEIEELGRIARLKRRFKDYVVIPMREKITDPLAEILSLISHKVDFYLNKIGNPLILRRFVYIFAMSFVIYYISMSGLLPNERTMGTRGMFSDKAQLIAYAKRAIDLSKVESDMEYLSRMPHMAGTKGDYAISRYVEESLVNNGIRLHVATQFDTYLDYPGNVSLVAFSNSGEEIHIETNELNFNPLSASGKVEGASLLYAHYGTKSDYDNLKEKGLLSENTVVLVHYGNLVSEQVLRAQQYGIKAILFISDTGSENDPDMVQRRSVALSQYAMGDPLTPGWASTLPKKIPFEDSPIAPRIPTIPLSSRQAQQLKKLLSSDGSLDFNDGWHSGKIGDATINLELENSIRPTHLSWNVVGKIEGREQNDKAIVIGAARDSSCFGASYPNFGTANLLSLVQLFQQIRYKFDWRPLRNIYFISYDASNYGNAGSTELLEVELSKMKNEIYAVLDISQLGIDPDNNKLDIQAHPLLFSFFNDQSTKMEFDINVRTVQQYGDWSSYMANGIPVAVLSTDHVRTRKAPIDTCSDTFEKFREVAAKDEWKKVSDTLLYVFQVVLKLVDDPLIPFSIGGYVSVVDELFKDLQKSTDQQLNFEPIMEGMLLWKRIGLQWDSWVSAWNNIVLLEDDGIEPSLLSVDRWTWNKKLANIGKRQCISEGLPDRKFYKNNVFGPALWMDDSHDSWSFPGVRDAIADEDWERAQEQINSLAKTLHKSANLFIEETNDVN